MCKDRLLSLYIRQANRKSKQNAWFAQSGVAVPKEQPCAVAIQVDNVVLGCGGASTQPFSVFLKPGIAQWRMPRCRDIDTHTSQGDRSAPPSPSCRPQITPSLLDSPADTYFRPPSPRCTISCPVKAYRGKNSVTRPCSCRHPRRGHIFDSVCFEAHGTLVANFQSLALYYSRAASA